MRLQVRGTRNIARDLQSKKTLPKRVRKNRSVDRAYYAQGGMDKTCEPEMKEQVTNKSKCLWLRNSQVKQEEDLQSYWTLGREVELTRQGLAAQ